MNRAKSEVRWVARQEPCPLEIYVLDQAMYHLFEFAMVAYGCAIAVGVLLRTRSNIAFLVGIGTVAPIVLTLLLVPPHQTILRGIAAFLATDLLLKIIDYRRRVCRAVTDIGSFRDYLRFLIPFPVMLVVIEQRNRRLAEAPRYWAEIGGIVIGAAGFACGSGLMYLAGKSVHLQSCFALDHVAKLAIVVILVESASRLLHHTERLAGYDTTPPMLNFVLSRTVGEFWCRWNTRIHAWLQYNVFLPGGGRRAPIRGVLHSFFWSAVLHEVMLGVATSRIDGYQFTFFMLQVPAVLLSRRMERFAQRHGIFGKAVAHLLTITWITVTSILFFPAIDRVFPFFYVSTPWLP